MKLGSRATVHSLTWVCQHVVIVESLFIIFEYLVGCSHQLEHLTSIGILSTHSNPHSHARGLISIRKFPRYLYN